MADPAGSSGRSSISWCCFWRRSSTARPEETTPATAAPRPLVDTAPASEPVAANEFRISYQRHESRAPETAISEAAEEIPSLEGLLAAFSVTLQESNDYVTESIGRLVSNVSAEGEDPRGLSSAGAGFLVAQRPVTGTLPRRRSSQNSQQISMNGSHTLTVSRKAPFMRFLLSN